LHPSALGWQSRAGTKRRPPQIYYSTKNFYNEKPPRRQIKKLLILKTMEELSKSEDSKTEEINEKIQKESASAETPTHPLQHKLEKPETSAPENNEKELKILREQIKSTPEALNEYRQNYQREQRRLERLRQEMAEIQEEQSKSDLQILIDLWKSNSNVPRLTFLWEFISNPNVLRLRYRQEMDFQKRLKSGWRIPKKGGDESEK
jgi:hypothetical protein